MSLRVRLILLGALAAIVGVIAMVLGQKSRASSLALAIQEQYHTTAITDAKAKADALMKSANVDEAQVKALQDDIDARKAKLSQSYVDAGMSNDEVAARLRALKL